MVKRYRQFRLIQINIINIALSYKRTLRIEVAYTNYLTSSLDIFVDKTPIPYFSVLFTYLSMDKKPYYSSSLSLNKSIDPTRTSL